MKRKGFLLPLVAMLLIIAPISGNAQIIWKTFTHHNGFTIQLPNYFKKGLLVASGTLQYFDNSLDSNITVSVESFGIGTTLELEASYSGDLKLYKGVSYKVLKPTWYVLSGQNEEGIFYNKSIIKDKMQYHLRIQYPPVRKAFFDKVLGQISASFK
jgi:hypothetical protein